MGTPSSLELTGGEYKTRERIHPGLADPGLLVIPASRGRLQTSIRTEDGFWDSLHLAVLHPFVPTIVLCVRPKVSEGHADLASSPPSSLVRGQSRLEHLTDNGGCVRYPTEGNSSNHELTTTMHHLCYTLEGSLPFGWDAVAFLILVRFFACRRIKPHNPLLVRVPVYSFEF